MLDSENTDDGCEYCGGDGSVPNMVSPFTQQGMKDCPECTEKLAGKTMAEWREFAKRDDCLDHMVPNDLRQLIDAI